MSDLKAGKTYALAASGANKKLIAKLENGGARVICFPAIETEKIALEEKSAPILNNLNELDWLIFFDVFAADYFTQAFEETGRDFLELDALRVCALGEAVADRLRFAQVHADVVPSSIETGAVVAALVDYVGEREIGGKRFLAVKKETGAENEIEKRLKEKGAVVAALEIYRAQISESGESAKLKALLAGGAVDEFIFAAPADFLALQEFLPDNLLREILRETKISAADQTTIQFLRERDLKTAAFSRK